MRGPDFFAALYVATASVEAGDIDEAEVTFDNVYGDRAQRLHVVVRRCAVEAVTPAE